MLTLKGRTAVIAGASGVVGYAILKQFLQAGMNVATIHSRQEKADMTDQWLRDFQGRYLTFSHTVQNFCEQVNEHFGGIDVLICGQGWPPVNQELEEISEDYWNSVINSNLTGSFKMVKKALPFLKMSNASRIIFLSSCEARTQGSHDGLAYTVAKGGVVSLTYGLASRLAKFGITVNAVAMGSIYNKPYPVGNETVPEVMPSYDDILDQIPLGRLAKPEDISTAVCYLASEEAGFVTGEVLNVNGGLFMG